MRTSCWESPKWDSFWIYFTAVNQFLGGMCKIFVQTNSIADSLIDPFASPPTLPLVGWSIPSVVCASVAAVVIAGGTALADGMGNYINNPENRAELNDRVGHRRSSEAINNEKIVTTDEESNHMGSPSILPQDETLALMPKKKPSRCCCQGLTVFQTTCLSLDITGHVLEATNWMFYCWLAVKLATGYDNKVVALIITSVALIIGYPASKAQNDSHIANVKDYNLLLEARKLAANTQLLDDAGDASPKPAL